MPERNPSDEPLRVDVAVVGAGVAGLYAAICAAREGARVAVVSRSPLPGSASYWAQGGIAAALAVGDSVERHAADTIEAGRGAARESAVRVLCDEAPERVRDLERLGVHFDSDRTGSLALGLEGGHSSRRVVHAGGSATGRRITRDLAALAATDARVEPLERSSAAAIVRDGERCAGVLAISAGGSCVLVLAGATILATGGAAALWQRTTNPPGAVGTGMSLAHAAGAELADLELTQFHPTALVHEGGGREPLGARDGFLITEAVRGEGATLLDERGERFVDELAPRDEVALAILAELRRSGRNAVWLDMRNVDGARFPNVVATLAEVGIDPSRELVPVAPAAHYTMGGVATDLDARSSLPGLLAVGECACTGLHGANRLASNSLAECLVFGFRGAHAALGERSPPAVADLPPAQEPGRPPATTRAALDRHAGATRSAAGLQQLAQDPYPLARLIARSALAREESRGAHQRTDLPQTDPDLDGMHTLVGAEGRPELRHWR